MKIKWNTIEIVLAILCLIFNQGCKKNMLTEKEIVSIADSVVESQNLKLDEKKVYYDVSNARWEETLRRVKTDNPDFAERFTVLNDRDYQSVVYSPIDTQVIGGVFWVFIDKKTGEVITWFGEK